MLTALRVIRLSLYVACLLVAVAIVSVAALPQVLPYIGRTPIVVTDRADLPSVPNGSLLIVASIDPAATAVGDTLAVRSAEGPTALGQVTARSGAAGSEIRLPGNNAGAETTIWVPETAILGKVELVVPALGDAMLGLGSTTGAVAAMVVLGVLMLMIWVAEGATTALDRAPRRGVAGVEMAR